MEVLPDQDAGPGGPNGRTLTVVRRTVQARTGDSRRRNAIITPAAAPQRVNGGAACLLDVL
jgi:hypothetical protein